MKRAAFTAIAVGLVLLPVCAATASETRTYTYDARGRLTGVSTASGPASGTSTSYQFDAAGNRTNVTTINN